VILNATVTRVDVVAGATRDGQASLTTGSAVAVRCALVKPSNALLRSAEANKVTVTAALFVLASALGTTIGPAVEQVWTVQIDGFGAGRQYRVRMVNPNAKAGGLSHYELGLEEATGV
jgi:cyanate permease